MYIKQALQYVKNTNGGATCGDFKSDFEPIGEKLWLELRNHDYVYIDPNGRIRLSDAGNAELDKP